MRLKKLCEGVVAFPRLITFSNVTSALLTGVPHYKDRFGGEVTVTTDECLITTIRAFQRD